MEFSPYNATVIAKIMLTPDLCILRIRTDDPHPLFKAGQFTTIGLLGQEPRSQNSVPSVERIADNEMIVRSYSIASANHQTQNFEFYISQVKSGQLTPRLFNLTVGSRLWVRDTIHGIFTLNNTPEGRDIVMVATGTGLAPYISFLRSHINDHREIKLAVMHGAAYPWDLGYLSELEFISSTFENFFYFPTLLKSDDNWPGLRGYIEEHLDAQVLQKVGFQIDPEKTHFFLCGNPKMVTSVSNYLDKFGYTRHTKAKPGSLHIESW